MKYEEKFSEEVLEKEKELAHFGVTDRFGAVILCVVVTVLGNILKVYNIPWIIIVIPAGMELIQNIFIMIVVLKMNKYQRWMRFMFPVIDAIVISIVIPYTGGFASPLFLAYFLGITHNGNDLGLGMAMYVGLISVVLYIGSLFVTVKLSDIPISYFNEILRLGLLLYVSFMAGTLGQRSLSKTRDLRKAMYEVENGNLDTNVEVKEKSEFGYLSLSFNKMMESLNIAKDQAIAIANDRLDDDILKSEFKGDFGKAFTEMNEKLIFIADIAKQIADDNLSMINMDKLDNDGTLSTAFRKMVERLVVISEYMNSIKAGKLNLELPEELKAGDVGSALYGNLTKLQEVIGNVKESSMKISGSSTQVLAASEELNTGATESAASIEETTSTIEEFSTTSRQIMENSNIVSSYAEDTLNNGLTLEEKVGDLIGSMNEIKQSSVSTTDRIMKLGDQSKEIADILSIIEDFSVQTKLLALNASIEAVGAGEAGKRFGVVAEEIKNLAGSVGDSTKRINEIIGNIKTSIEESVISSESQIKDVNSGVDKLSEVKSFTSKLKGVMEKTTDASKQIKLSTMQQKTAGDQLLGAMKDISSVANQTATSTKELVSLVENLNTISEIMKEMSDFFEL